MVATASGYPSSVDTVPSISSVATLAEAEHTNLHTAAFNRVRAVQNSVGLSSDYSGTGPWDRQNRTVYKLLSDLATQKMEASGGTGSSLTITNSNISNSVLTGTTQTSLTVTNGSSSMTGVLETGQYRQTSTNLQRLQGTTVSLESKTAGLNYGMSLFVSPTSLYVKDAYGATGNLLSLSNTGNLTLTGEVAVSNTVTLGVDGTSPGHAVRKSQLDTVVSNLNGAEQLLTQWVNQLLAGMPRSGQFVGIASAYGFLYCTYNADGSPIPSPPAAVLVTNGAFVNGVRSDGNKQLNNGLWVEDGSNAAFPAPSRYGFWVGGLSDRMVRVMWVALAAPVSLVTPPSPG